MSDSVEKLIEMFSKFPGIGPRQARRFVYHLLQQTDSSLSFLSQKILALKQEMTKCERCKRFFNRQDNSNQKLCVYCADGTRDQTILMVVAKDVDLEIIEKTHSFNGFYFVLGGLLKLMDKEPEKHVRLSELSILIRNNKEIKEIVLAMNANTEGDYTEDYVRNRLTEIFPERELKITVLGRGLSTGTELEYSDSDTITYALKNRF